MIKLHLGGLAVKLCVVDYRTWGPSLIECGVIVVLNVGSGN